MPTDETKSADDLDAVGDDSQARANGLNADEDIDPGTGLSKRMLQKFARQCKEAAKQKREHPNNAAQARKGG